MAKKPVTKSADAPVVKKASQKRKMTYAILHVQSTYNNTKVVLADERGNSVALSSAGALGFKGAKKGTPFAAAKIGEALADKAIAMGVKEVGVVVKGTGSGRESVIRSFITKGISVDSIKDRTPVPHNGPKPKKPRRI
ncbi:MAG: ribosomal protein [Candidatus Parcubacteria bacterium]|jgi:small subunit ribosomal protein S11